VTAAIAPDRLLKELADLWVTLGKDGESGVLRACSMTLVVLAEESEDVSALGETMAALMPEHPARTIVVRLSGDGPRALTERVYAQCWMPFGQRRQICCEQIEIGASDAALGDLPSVILPLAVADLPLIIWSRSARLAGRPEFRDIGGMARKVVLDTAPFDDPKAALQRLAAVSARGVIMGDLAWTRLTRWREMLSQVFQNRQQLAKLSAVSELRVAFAAGLETSAWYFAAWVSDVLAAAGIQARTSVNPDQQADSLRLELSGEGVFVSLTRSEGRLIAKVDHLTTCTSLPQPTDYLLMREELAIVRRDPVFEHTRASAARLAYATDK
jgi:glucose-6-phosphate dehydrogenase assembly protein OpcA